MNDNFLESFDTHVTLTINDYDITRSTVITPLMITSVQENVHKCTCITAMSHCIATPSLPG